MVNPLGPAQGGQLLAAPNDGWLAFAGSRGSGILVCQGDIPRQEVTMKLLRTLVAIVGVLGIAASCAGALAQSAPREGEVRALIAAAAKDRADAARATELAAEWNKLADEAQREADATTNSVAKEVWADTVARHRARAAEYEAEAARLAARAAEKEAQAARLQAEIDKSRVTPEPQPTGGGETAAGPPSAEPSGEGAGGAGEDAQDGWVPVESLLGIWETTYDYSEIRIEAIDPTAPEREDGLRLTTKRHSYVGSYVRGLDPQPARLKFVRRPKAEEMNREVPLWARQKVQDKLEWVFEFDEIDDCLCSGLKGKWYPGEISWNEAARDATVSGKGEPIEVTYRPKPPDPTEQIKAPVLFVQSRDTRTGSFEPLQSIAFKSPFRIQVLLPPELAEKQGAELTVVLKAEKTWSSAKATLKGSRLPSGVWSYATDPPVTLVPVPTTGDTTWFRAKDGELVTVTYTAPDGATASDAVSIYQNNVYQALARNEETLAWLETTYESLLGPRTLFDSRAVAPHERRILEQKLKLVRNARKILTYNLPELVALGIGDVYVNLIQREPLAGDPRYFGDQTTSHPYNFDVEWVDAVERRNVDLAIVEARDRYANIFLNLGRDFGVDTFYGLFLSGIDQTLIVFGGTDLQGRSYDTASRVLAGIQGVTNIALAGITGSLAAKAQSAKMPRAQAEREAWRARRNAREGAIRAAAEFEGRFDDGLGPVAARRSGQRGGFLSHKRSGQAFHEDLDGLPASAAFDPAPDNRLPDRLFQCRFNVCALMSTVHAGRKKGRVATSAERDLLRLAGAYDLIDDRGIRSRDMPKLARLLGLDYEFRERMTLAEIAQALKRGDAVVGGMRYLNEKGVRTRSGHAIHILEILRSSETGQPTYVKYWDPGTGRRIGMLACDFLKIYDPTDVLLIK